MVDTTAARIIRNASQSKFYIIFPESVFERISSTQALTSNEKLVWLNIARRIVRDANLSCVLTHQQIATMTGMRPDSSYRVVKRLRQKGFLQASNDALNQRVRYSIDLPKEMLRAVEEAPSRSKADSRGHSHNENVLSSNKAGAQHIAPEITTESALLGEGEGQIMADVSPDEEVFMSDSFPEGLQMKSQLPPDEYPVPPGSTSDTPPDEHPILSIEYNNNNKHKDHDKRTPAISLNALVERDADALLCDFENYQKQYSDLDPFERMRKLKSHFSDEEMRIIAEQNLEKDREAQRKVFEEQRTAMQEEFNLSCSYVSCDQKTKSPLSESKRFCDEIDPNVKSKILSQIPKLYELGDIKGEARIKPLDELISEISYYVSWGGKEHDSQLKRFFIARKICRKGKWKRPKGMVFSEILDRERDWRFEKQREMRWSKACLEGIT